MYTASGLPELCEHCESKMRQDATDIVRAELLNIEVDNRRMRSECTKVRNRCIPIRFKY